MVPPYLRQERRLEPEPCLRGRSRPMAARGCAGSPVRVTEYPGTDLLTNLRSDNLSVAAEQVNLFRERVHTTAKRLVRCRPALGCCRSGGLRWRVHVPGSEELRLDRT